MVRPSDAFLEAEAEARQRDIEDKAGESLIPTYQPSDVPLWRGDERDWQRLCKVSKVIARDGPKLDLWKGWLTDMLMERDKGKYNPPEVSDDDSVIVVANESYQLPNERPLREWVLTILKNHVSIFVFFINCINSYEGKGISVCLCFPRFPSPIWGIIIEGWTFARISTWCTRR